MRVHANINERTVRHPFGEHLKDHRALAVFDKGLRGFCLKVSPKGIRTFIVRAE